MKLLFFISLFIIGYLTGRHIELRHFQSIRDREERYHHIAMISGSWKDHIDPESDCKMFDGSVVVGADYFKSVISGLRAVFGGGMNNYETLLDRGRREALVRMLADADRWGADRLVNVRVETSVIGSQSGKRALPCVEIHVYATGLRKLRHEVHS